MSKAMLYLSYAVIGAQVVITGHAGESRNTFTADDVVEQITIPVDSFADSYLTAGGEEKNIKAYGINSLLQDRSSQAVGVEAKFAAMKAEAERMQQEGALWSEAREAVARAPKAPKTDALLVAAIAELKGVSIVVAATMLAKLDKDKAKALAELPAVADKVAELKAAAQSAEASDLDDLFA